MEDIKQQIESLHIPTLEEIVTDLNEIFISEAIKINELDMTIFRSEIDKRHG